MGSTINLSVTPDPKFGFQGWSGDCASSGTQSFCSSDTVDAALTDGDFRSTLNYVFVTSTAPASLNFGVSPDVALSAADSFCNQKANGRLPGQYVAWLSTSASGSVAGVDAVKRLIIGGDPTKPARGWIRPDGRPFADSAATLTAGNQVFYPIAIDETGADASGRTVATGTKSDGTLSTGNCQNWAPLQRLTSSRSARTI